MNDKNTFLDYVLSVSTLPRMRKIIFPVLIILFAAFILFFKVNESLSVNTLVDENIASHNELSLRNSLQMSDKDLLDVEKAIKKSVEGGERTDNQLVSKLNLIQENLDQIAIQYEETKSLAKYSFFIDLLKRKADSERNILFELQKGSQPGALAILDSKGLKIINDSLLNAGSNLRAELMALPPDIVQSVRANSKKVHFWSIMVFLGGFICCLLTWLYVYVKTKQNSDSEKKAKASLTIKENFLANMSHEIRTPLNAVLGFTNILKNSDLKEEQQEILEIIHQSGNNLLTIVNDILDLSKIEAGMLRIEESPFRINDIMFAVEAMLKPKAEEKNLKLVINVDSDVPGVVSGDAVRLTQVLVNLISNAIKFTEEGGVYVKATPFKKSGDSIKIEFLVRDTGIGIPADKQAAIFGRFEQAEAATTRRFGGTGLGLPIVKHLIELQNGSISLNSQPGAGSIFLFELPFKLTNEVVVNSEAKKVKQNPNNMNKETKILIAEDNVMNQHLIKHLMKSWNFDFDLVFNGAQAIEALKTHSYDIVLMDIQMPEMDGYTAAGLIRSRLKSAIPVIAMTAHAMEGEREKCLKAGMNDYLSKPIDQDKLFEIIFKYSKTDAADAKEPQVQEKGAKVIDLQYIEKYADGDPNFKQEVIQEFIKTVPANINSLEAAISQGNYSTIRTIAHDMKTTVHIMGLTLLIGHLLQQIESYAHLNIELSSILRMFGDVKQVCLQAVQEAGRLVA